MLASAAKAEFRFAWSAADFFEHWRAGAGDKLWNTDIRGSACGLKVLLMIVPLISFCAF
jgi:hypothetical protein